MRLLLFSMLGICIFASACTKKEVNIQAESRNPICSGFDDSQWDFNVATTISYDKSSITAKGGKNYIRIAHSKEGLLKPDTDYLLEFNVSLNRKKPVSELEKKQSAIPSLPKSQEHLHLTLRPISEKSHKQDIFRKNFYLQTTPAKWTKRFKTPKDIRDYSVQFSLKGDCKVEISNIKISEGTGCDFYPIEMETKIPPSFSKNIPSGCPEFEVKLPNTSKDSKIVNASDFGLNEERTDCREILQNAINFCKKIKASKLVIPKGTYKLYTDGNLQLTYMKDFTLDAQGSTFIYLRKKGCSLYLGSTERVKICNLNMDWNWNKFPLASVVKIENIHRDSKAYESYIDLKFLHYKVHPFYKNPETPAIVLHPWNDETGYDKGQHSLYLSGLYDGVKAPKSQWLNENTLRIFISSQERLKNQKTGGIFRLQHNYYSQSCIVLDSAKHTTFENVNVYSCAGHGVLVGGLSEFMSFKNFNIAPAKDAPKTHCMSCSADHFHVATSKGFIKLDNCHFGYGGDDCINIHDTSCFAVYNSSNSILANNCSEKKYRLGELLELRHEDFSPSGYIGKIKKITPLKKKNEKEKPLAIIEFGSPIPEQKLNGFVIFNKSRCTQNVSIKNCKFERKRGVLILCKNVTIEDCEFNDNIAGALKFETGYTYNIWSEGTGVRNAVVRNCKFKNPNESNKVDMGFIRDIWLGAYTGFDNDTQRQTPYPIISDILFENNSFEDISGLIAIIASSQNITFKSNTIYCKNDKSRPYYLNCFYLNHSKDIAFINNTWEDAKDCKVGIYADWRSTKNIYIKNNKVKE